MNHNTPMYSFDMLSQQAALYHQDDPQPFVLPPFPSAGTVADTPANAMVPQSNNINSSMQESGSDSLTGLHDNLQQSQYMIGLEQQIAQLVIHTPPTTQLITPVITRLFGLQGRTHDFVQEQQLENFVIDTENHAPRVQDAVQLASRYKCKICNKHYHSKKQLHKHSREIHRM